MKKLLSLILSAVILTSAICAVPAAAQAKGKTEISVSLLASKKSINKKAKKLYKKKIQKIKKKRGETYTIYDIDGDGIKELLLSYHAKSGSGSFIEIYKYQKGKLKRIFYSGGYGLSSFTFYNDTNALMTDSYGHGGEHQDYYVLVNGKYSFVASKGRQSERGGGYNGEWSYNNADYDELTEDEFYALVNSLTTGATRVTKTKTWKWMYKNKPVV